MNSTGSSFAFSCCPGSGSQRTLLQGLDTALQLPTWLQRSLAGSWDFTSGIVHSLKRLFTSERARVLDKTCEALTRTQQYCETNEPLNKRCLICTSDRKESSSRKGRTCLSLQFQLRNLPNPRECLLCVWKTMERPAARVPVDPNSALSNCLEVTGAAVRSAAGCRQVFFCHGRLSHATSAATEGCDTARHLGLNIQTSNL